MATVSTTLSTSLKRMGTATPVIEGLGYDIADYERLLEQIKRKAAKNDWTITNGSTATVTETAILRLRFHSNPTSKHPSDTHTPRAFAPLHAHWHRRLRT